MSQQKKRLVLFDIDGTMVWSDGVGRVAMKAALQEVFGTSGAIDRVKFGGQCDRSIVRQLLEGEGVPTDTIWEQFDTIGRAMEVHLERVAFDGSHHVRACPGVNDLLADLSAHPDVTLGLVTGNFRRTAAVKLRAAGFDPTAFPLGAYGDESESRSDLPPLAVERANQLVGHRFDGQQVVIIGDTVDDVVCARSVGARTIAVLTGFGKRDALATEGADYLFDDLTPTADVLDAIFAATDGPGQ